MSLPYVPERRKRGWLLSLITIAAFACLPFMAKGAERGGSTGLIMVWFVFISCIVSFIWLRRNA